VSGQGSWWGAAASGGGVCDVSKRGARRGLLALGWVLLAAAGVSTPSALTDEEIYRNFRFNLVNPGARALGMGGAFIAVADDPTTAQANPAGLDFLRAPQFFIEYRNVETDDETFGNDLGSLAVDPNSGDRQLPYLGLTSGGETGTFSAPSYASFTWPLHLGWADRRLTLAAGRHVLLDEERSLPGSGGTGARFSFDSFPLTVNGSAVESYAIDSTVSGGSSIEIVSWDVSAAVELHQDFSAGLTLSVADLDLESRSATQVNDPQAVLVDPGNPRLPSTPEADVYRTDANGSDTDLTWTVGIHWHPDSIFASGSSPWRFGAVYRRGAKFSVEESITLNGVEQRRFENTISVPDRFSLGMSYAFLERWLVAAEIERVEYSDQIDGFEAGVNYLTSPLVAGGLLGISASDDIEFEVDDGTIVRTGVEYVMPVGAAGHKLALRAGYYRTPDSRIRMTDFDSGDSDVNDTYLDTFPGGEAEDHFTAGVGFTIGRSVFSIAGDTSDNGTQIVGSFVLAFDKEAR
jgi:long-chain fatty acid transport protein